MLFSQGKFALFIFADISTFGIESPVNVERLAVYLKGYADEQFVIEGFRKGFPLGVKRDFHLLYGKVKPRPSPLPLLSKLSDEVAKGRIIGPFSSKPFPDLFISPLYVIPKPNSDKYRMIFNLSHPVGGAVNDNIPELLRSVQYCSVQDVGQCMMSNYGDGVAWLAKVDLADAYRIVPIRREDWRFLGIYIEDEYYVDRMLPMGASSSCQLFSRISDSLVWMFYKHSPVQAHLFNYLDDFLFVADSQKNCERALSVFEELCEATGVPIAPHKTVRPVKRLVFLGIGIDAERMAMYIPTEKRDKMICKLNQFLSRKTPRVKEWQSLAGSLNHISQVIASARIYLSSIYESLSGILSQRQDKRRTISEEVAEDLRVWFSLLHTPPERPFRMLDSSTSCCPDVYTDASTSVGFGCMWGSSWFSGSWPYGKKCNIAVLELYPIYVVLTLLSLDFSDMAINIFTDNMAVTNILNKLYCKDKSLRKMMRKISEICMGRNIRIIARHISGELNVGADLLSRGLIEKFFQTYPTMNRVPVKIPQYLQPQNSSVISWK